MQIDTHDEYEAVSACCDCSPGSIPFPAPARQIQALEADAVVFAVVRSSGIYYRRRTINYGDGGSHVTLASRGWQAYISRVGLGGGALQVDPVSLQYIETPPLTGGADPPVYDLPITDFDAERDSAMAAIIAEPTTYWDSFTPKTSPSFVTRTHSPANGGSPDYILTVDLVRFKWDITHHVGGWYKVTWDFAFYPTAGGPAVPMAVDQTWEWTGAPGGPPPGSEDSWKSDWIYFPHPTAEGQVKIVNIRFSAFRSTKLGELVNVTGDAEDYA